METYSLINDSVSYKGEYQTQRTIEEILDVETGEIIFSEDFFKQDEAIIILARQALEISIQSDIPKYKCIFCEQNIKITGRRIFEKNKTIYFFAHFKDSDDCPIKTNVGLGFDEILAKKYQGLKESELHGRLKNFIAQRLEDKNAIQKGFKNVLIEKQFKNREISEHWRRPDVKTTFNDKSLVFELQLSTTFLSVIVGREAFYRKHQTFIIWVFAGLDEREDWQKLMEKDIYYAHKRNVFLLDKHAEKLSDEKGELVLHCFWQTPEIINGKVKITWHKKFITLDELTYNTEIYDAYYYNSDKDFYDIADTKQKAIIDNWEKAKEKRWDKIKERIKKRALSEYQQIKLIKHQQNQEEELLRKIANKEIKPVRFELNGKWGYKIKHHIVVEPKFTKAEPFKLVVSQVETEGKKEIIDFNGNVIYTLGDNSKMDCVLSLGENYIIKIVDSYRKYNRLYRHYETIESIKFIIYFNKNNKPIQEEYAFIGEFENERAIVYKTVWESQSLYKIIYGVIDINGIEIAPCKYDKIQKYKDGKAAVRIKGINGYIDEYGNGVIDEVLYIENGNIRAKKMGLWAILNSDSVELTPFIYSEIGIFENRRAIVKKEGKYGYINENGDEIISCIYDEIQYFIKGRAKAKRNDKHGYINEIGNELIACVYDEIQSFIGDRAKVSRNNKYGYIDENGNEIIACVYDEIQNFIGNRAKAKKNGKYGYIDENGNETIACVYDKIELFTENKAKVEKNYRYGFIDENGKVLISTIFSYKMLDEVVSVNKIDNIEIYENTHGDFVIPSINYLANFRVLNFFRKNSVKAKVIGVADFGIFLSLNSEICKGLLHKSEILKAKLNMNESQFEIGNVVDVYIHSIEPEKDRISFSFHKFKKPLSNFYPELKNLEGSIVEGKIANLKEYGLFVEICENTVGLVHISNLKRNGYEEKSIEKHFKKGDIINVVIISVELEKKRIELGCMNPQAPNLPKTNPQTSS